MKFTKMTIAAGLIVAVAFTSFKPKDSEIKANVETALKADMKMASTMVDVQDGKVTLSGECTDAECKANCEKTAAGVKGVKPPVVNNLTLAAPIVVEPAPASTTTVLDAATQQKVKDGLKDMPSVSVEFTADKAVLSGEVSKSQRMTIMQMLMAANVKSDVSNLMDKK
ncbi:MAG: BON domain-containing protein [Ferruginibacter sp.]|nr:BON domain-containing protein [Ferruginibacter sp.]